MVQYSDNTNDLRSLLYLIVIDHGIQKVDQRNDLEADKQVGK
jgi:hypothetical protein